MMSMLPRIVLIAAGALVFSTSAIAAPQRLAVATFIGTQSIACNAASARISRTPPLRVQFDCTSAQRFRCDLTGAASYTVSNNRISANCFGITEVPRSNPGDLMFAAGGEG